MRTSCFKLSWYWLSFIMLWLWSSIRWCNKFFAKWYSYQLHFSFRFCTEQYKCICRPGKINNKHFEILLFQILWFALDPFRQCIYFQHGCFSIYDKSTWTSNMGNPSMIIQKKYDLQIPSNFIPIQSLK